MFSKMIFAVFSHSIPFKKIISIGNADLQREEYYFHWFTFQVASMLELYQFKGRIQEPGASSESIMWMQGSKALSYPLLSSQAASRKLDGKWSSQDDQHSCGSWCLPLSHHAGPNVRPSLCVHNKNSSF